jgi:hypothetical protein
VADGTIWFCYMVRCNDGSLWWQEFPEQKAARHRERELKGWRREKKLKLLLDFGDGITLRPQRARSQGESPKVGEIGITLQPQKARLQGESPKVGDSGESSNG